MASITDIRENFIKYFRSKSHKLSAPSKVFIEADDSLLFVNAGMNQFKDRILSGIDDVRTDDSDPTKRLCNSQICIRAGGKHNDLDDVGEDSYHLTSFEMLGNWSMNNYQKQETICMAYGYLVDHLHLDPTRIYVTYFEGDESKGLPPDLETKKLWERIVDTDRVLPGSFDDNFWMMGDIGPCGACTEIHYDISPESRFCAELVNQDDPQVIEIWNNVFMEMVCSQEPDKSYVYQKMSNFYVDTGMGLERLAMVVQGKPTIYQTDGFHYLFGYARALCNIEYPYSDMYMHTCTDSSIVQQDRAYRIFADHFRTLVIALYDGARFDITGRGSVLRKICRRLLTNTYIYLNNYKVEPLMNHPIVGAIITSVLNYHLKYRHDRQELQELLITEEKLYLGMLWNSKKRVDSVRKKIAKSAESDSNDSQMQRIIASLKSAGIPEEIVTNIDELVISKKCITN